MPLSCCNYQTQNYIQPNLQPKCTNGICNNIQTPCYSNFQQQNAYDECCRCNNCPIFGVSCVYNNFQYASYNYPWYKMIPYWLWIIFFFLSLLLLLLILCFCFWCLIKRNHKIFNRSFKPISHMHLESPPSVIIGKNLNQFKKFDESAEKQSANYQSSNNFDKINNISFLNTKNNQNEITQKKIVEKNFDKNENYCKTNDQLIFSQYNNNNNNNKELNNFEDNKSIKIDEHAPINLTPINDLTANNGKFYQKKIQNKQTSVFPISKQHQTISRSTSHLNFSNQIKEERKKKLFETKEMATFNAPLYGLIIFYCIFLKKT